MSTIGPNQMPAAWSAAANGYADHLAQWDVYAAEALRLAPPSSTDRVLDVACGPGTLSIPAARTAREVVAVDFAPGMIEVLARRTTEAGVPNVSAAVMDAQALTLPDASFDLVYCLFGAMFFPDRAKAFAEMHRVLRPGGRLVVGTWGPLERRPMMKIGFDAMAEAMPGAPTPAKGDLQEPAECEAELAAAGFRDVEVHPFVGRMRIESPRAYMIAITEAGAPAAVMRQRLGEDAFEALRAKLLVALEARIPKDGMELSAEALLSVARRPAR